ncbi:MAG TPA: sigma-70 family RNA polymerase sigma factor, partial [Candidatus Limnocylindrales bacterium]|nr:sigma-70 family RNA polymerase sigma factor [Candidatus Limnocylindrales bacterium]
AEDATQRALLAVWQDLPQLRDPTRFEAWSYRVLIRACRAEGWRERRALPSLRLLPIDASGADDELAAVVDRDQLERGFRRLSLDHRTVVVLHHFLDLPLDRVAEIVGIPTGTAHSRLHHAMRALRAALEADSRAPVREVV